VAINKWIVGEGDMLGVVVGGLIALAGSIGTTLLTHHLESKREAREHVRHRYVEEGLEPLLAWVLRAETGAAFLSGFAEGFQDLQYEKIEELLNEGRSWEDIGGYLREQNFERNSRKLATNKAAGKLDAIQSLEDLMIPTQAVGRVVAFTGDKNLAPFVSILAIRTVISRGKGVLEKPYDTVRSSLEEYLNLYSENDTEIHSAADFRRLVEQQKLTDRQTSRNQLGFEPPDTDEGPDDKGERPDENSG
jgi:hypothetical protein